MKPKKALLPESFGSFSKIPPARVTEISSAARALAQAYRSGDVSAWASLIKLANENLTKAERGFFIGIAYAEALND